MYNTQTGAHFILTRTDAFTFSELSHNYTSIVF